MTTYQNLIDTLTLDIHQNKTDDQLLIDLNASRLIAVKHLTVSINSLAVDHGLDYDKMLDLLGELQYLAANSDAKTAAKISMILSGNIDLGNEIVRTELEAFIDAADDGTAMKLMLPLIKRLAETWRSDSEDILGRDITQLDIDKARLIRESQFVFDDVQHSYFDNLASIENWDGTGDTPTIYGA